MATTRCLSRDSRVIDRIDSVIDGHQNLSPLRSGLSISIENAQIMLRGTLPSDALLQELILAVRQAGALGQICNDIQVGTAS